MISTRRSVSKSGLAYRTLPQYLANALPETQEGFETIGEWTPGSGATVTSDTTHVKQGSQSINLAGNGSNIWMQKTVSWNLPASKMTLWIYVEDASKLNSVILFFVNRPDFLYYFQSPTITGLVNGWNFVTLRMSDFSNIGAISWSDPMVIFRVRISTSDTTSVSVDDLQVGLVTQPAAVIAFDDGWDSSYLSGFEYARQRHIRQVHYLISSNIDSAGHVTAAQAQDMLRAGWDISNHSSDATEFTSLSQAEIEANLATCATALEALGAGDSRFHVAYPSGAYNADTFAAMAAQGMLTGRTTVNRSFDLWSIEQQSAWYELPVYTLNSVNNFSSAIATLDLAVTRGEITIFMLHKLGIADTMTWPVFSYEALIDYLIWRNIPVLTMTDIWALRSGPITVPSYFR